MIATGSKMIFRSNEIEKRVKPHTRRSRTSGWTKMEQAACKTGCLQAKHLKRQFAEKCFALKRTV